MYQKNESTYRKYKTLHNLSLIKVCTAPELRYTPDGKKVCSFSTVFVESYGTFPENQMYRESWVKVTGWEKQAETMQQLTKGDWILIETVVPGLDTWTTAEGETRSGLSMTMKGFPRKVSLVSSGGAAPSEPGASTPATQTESEMPPEDDIPF
jgi:single-stranded DNA-binding protein